MVKNRKTTRSNREHFRELRKMDINLQKFPLKELG